MAWWDVVRNETGRICGEVMAYTYQEALKKAKAIHGDDIDVQKR